MGRFVVLSRLVPAMVLLLLSQKSAFAGQSSLYDVLRSAADAFGQQVPNPKSTLELRVLNGGICLQRTDPSSAVQPCSDEPSGYYFISFGNPFYDSKANMSSPQPQSPSTIHYFCTNEGSSRTPRCQSPSTSSFEDTVMFQNTQTLKEGGSVTVGGDFNLDIPGSISLAISDSTAHTLTNSNSGSGGIRPQLGPGQCALVTVDLHPSLTTGTLGYYVPITGGISAWYKDSVSVPTMMSMGRHYDWNLYVEDLEQYVQGDHFPTQNGQLCFRSSIYVTAMSYNGQAQVSDADCTTRQPKQGAAIPATTLAALRSSHQEQGG